MTTVAPVLAMRYLDGDAIAIRRVDSNDVSKKRAIISSESGQELSFIGCSREGDRVVGFAGGWIIYLTCQAVNKIVLALAGILSHRIPDAIVIWRHQKAVGECHHWFQQASTSTGVL